MASRSSLRQVSQAIRNNRLHLQPSRTQNFSSHSLFQVPASTRTRSFPTRQATYFVQQSRNLSLWGSSTPKPAPPADAAPTSNLDVSEPSHFETTRTVKAHDTGSDFSSPTPNALEPQFVEDVQHAIVKPHGVNAPDIPLEQIPERIGYLKEVCGIDFGWGPSAFMQTIFETIHITGAVSWTAAIVAMAVVIRASQIPFMISSAKEAQKLKLVAAATKPYREKYQEALAKGDNAKAAEIVSEMNIVGRTYGVKYLRLLAPMMIQLPLGFGAWRNLRNCADLPVPGFVTESWLWNIDLTFSDQFWIVPGLSALFIWLSLNVNQKVATATGTGTMANPDAMRVLKSVLPSLSFIFMGWQPGAVQLYFLVSSAMGYATTLLMSNNAWRRYFGLLETKVQDTKASSLESPKDFMKRASAVGTDRAAATSEDLSRTAADQNLSKIDQYVNSWKRTFKSLTDKAKEVQNTNAKKTDNNSREEARLRAAMDKARRERNAKAGAQPEKETRR